MTAQLCPTQEQGTTQTPATGPRLDGYVVANFPGTSYCDMGSKEMANGREGSVREAYSSTWYVVISHYRGSVANNLLDVDFMCRLEFGFRGLGVPSMYSIVIALATVTTIEPHVGLFEGPAVLELACPNPHSCNQATCS
jgi:hypothetical protein